MTQGKAGEVYFAEASAQMGYTVEDLSNTREYWYKDIDFKLTNPTTGNSRYFEVKTDNIIYKTGNLFIETWSRDTIQPNNKGWYLVCEADYIAYIDWHNKRIHTFLLEDLQALLSSKHYQKRRCRDEAEGYIVPLMDVKKLPSYLEV